MTKLNSTIPLLVVLASIAVPASARAQLPAQLLCIADTQDATMAVQRAEWARRCALTTNTGGPSSWFSSEVLDTTGSPAKEYSELNPNRSYSGSRNDHEVNIDYAFMVYQFTGVYTVAQETSGATAGFWKWSHTVQRPHPLYPAFGTAPIAGSGIQLFPLPSLPNDCNLYTRSGGTFTRWTGSFFMVTYCVSQ